MLWIQLHVAYETVGHYVPVIQEADDDNTDSMIITRVMAEHDGEDIMEALFTAAVQDVHVLAILASLILSGPKAYSTIVVRALGIKDNSDSCRAFMQIINDSYLLAVEQLDNKSGQRGLSNN